MINNPIISGLSIKFDVGITSTPDLLGPALYAGIGAKIIGKSPDLITTISEDDMDFFFPLLEKLNIGSNFVTTINRKPLLWKGVKVQNNQFLGNISDSPNLWCNYDLKKIPLGKPLFLANNHPKFNLFLVEQFKPSFLAIDLYKPFIDLYKKEIEICLQKSNLIMGTEFELACFSSIFIKNCLENPHTIIVCKKGPRGVDILNLNNVYHFPPPHVNKVLCDLGAGDLLFGALSASYANIFFDSFDNHIEKISNSYNQITPFIALLLEEPSPDHFFHSILEKI